MKAHERAAAEWEPTTQNHDPRHLAFARECYAAGYEAGGADVARLERGRADLRAACEAARDLLESTVAYGMVRQEKGEVLRQIRLALAGSE